MVCRVVLLSLLLVAVWSFDTGHHADVTASVVRNTYSDDATKVVQVLNYFSDHYAQRWFEFLGVDDLWKIHFDGLETLDQVNAYWAHLTANTKSYIDVLFSKTGGNYVLSLEKRQLYFLATVGISTHAVQDFYTHSNWVKLMKRSQCTCLRIDTFFSHGTSSVTGLTTGFYDKVPCPANGRDEKDFAGHIVHGGYCDGVNKDSFNRPLFDESYAFAYAGTHEWVSLLHSWANAKDGTFLDSLATYSAGSDRNDLDEALDFGYTLSSFVQAPGLDGHYKGWLSGSATLFASELAQFSDSSSVYIELITVQHIQNFLIKNLYSYGGPKCATVAAPDISFVTAPIKPVGELQITLKLWSYTVSDVSATTNPYAIITIDGQEFKTAALRGLRDAKPDWSATAFLSVARQTALAGVVPITIQLWRLRTQSSSDVEQYEIDGTATTYSFSYTTLTQTCGTKNCKDKANSVVLNGNDVDLSFYITQHTLGGCSTGGAATCTDLAQGPADISQWKLFCQDQNAQVDICVKKTTETGSSCRNSDMQAAVSSAASMETYDVSVLSCDQQCNEDDSEDDGNSILYSITLYGPDSGPALENRVSSLVEQANANSLNGFTVVYSNSGVELCVSWVLVLLVAAVGYLGM